MTKYPKLVKIIFLISYLLFTCTEMNAQSRDSIIKINIPGADTIMSDMTVSDNGIIHFTTNRQFGIFSTLTGQNIKLSGKAHGAQKDKSNYYWRLYKNTIVKEDENGNKLSSDSIPTSLLNTNGHIRDIVKDSRNRIWLNACISLLIKTGTGWIKYDSSNSAIKSGRIIKILADNDSNIWVLSDSGILNIHDTICAKCSAWITVKPKFLGGQIKSIAFGKNGNLLLGTWWGRIYSWDKGTLDTLAIWPKSELQTAISAIAVDDYGNIWAGTWGKGLLKISPDGKNMIKYNTSNSNLGYNYINAVVKGKDGYIYIGTSSAGIYKVIPVKDSSFYHYKTQPASITTEKTKEGFTIYPNPSHGIFSISARKPGTYKLCIQDISGKLLLEKDRFFISQKSDIDMSTFQPGIYVLNIYDGKKLQTTQKLTIQ
jgi:hypothetical protein